jgi:hypothetical protein
MVGLFLLPHDVEQAPPPAAFGVASVLVLLDPEPAIVLRLVHQPTPHWIPPYVFQLLCETLVRSQDMIKRFLLPHGTGAPKRSIHPVGRGSFYSLQNLNEAVRGAVCLTKRGQQQVHMIRHNPNSMNLSFHSLVVEAMPQDDLSDWLGQRSVPRTKRHKQSPIALLIVRQSPAVLVLPLQRSLRHDLV